MTCEPPRPAPTRNRSRSRRSTGTPPTAAAYQPRYHVPVTVTATVHITADDADSAQRRVRYLIDGLAYSGDSDDDEVEVTLDDTQVGDPETA